MRPPPSGQRPGQLGAQIGAAHERSHVAVEPEEGLPLNGTVEVTEIPRRDWPPSRDGHLIKRKLLYRWVPPYQLTEDLPPWYDLCLVYDVFNDGGRRFSPVGKELLGVLPPSEGLRYVAGTSGLAIAASLGGHAIIIDRDKIEKDLPLLLLHSRFDFLKEAILRTWNRRQDRRNRIRASQGVRVRCQGSRRGKETRGWRAADR